MSKLAQTMRERKKALTIGAVIALLAVSAVGIAALLSRAEINADATTGDQSIFFATYSTVTGPKLETDSVTTAVVADGACNATLVDGALNITWTDIWEGSECVISGPGASNAFLGVATANAPATVTGWDFPTGYGAPASGEPIEVRLLDGSDAAISFPVNLTIPAPAKTVKIKLTVNAVVAEASTNYAGTLALLGN